MMMKEHCNCFHHKLIFLITVLVWLAVIGFFYTSWTNAMVMNMGANYFFESVVVLSLLIWGTKFCPCKYNHHAMCQNCEGVSDEKNAMACKHGKTCTCGNCEGCK